jgi:cobalt-zinc-cadmium efflux system outer membrane protein
LAAPLDLETALEWTVRYHPNLVIQRQNAEATAEAIAVARQFPTSLNPTVALEVTPWVFQRQPGDGVQRLNTFVNVNWQQPIELGHRRRYRTEMAQASYDQACWNALQTELAALVGTYRFHQGATYRGQKLAVAGRLADFNVQLVQSLKRQAAANQVGPAEVVLAEVEAGAAAQGVETARREYVVALAELRGQFALPEGAALIEPTGLLRPPGDNLPGTEDDLAQLAMESRPEISAAVAQAANSRAALSLARADRIPVPSVGPVYEHNETGASFYGFGLTTPIPLLNTGGALVRQREAEYHRDCVALEQVRQQVRTQVQAVLAKWNQVRESAARTRARREPIAGQVDRMQRLFDAGQTDLVKLLQVHQRLIEAENAQLDAQWQSIEAYADLLAAVGWTPLLGLPTENR